MKKSISLLLTIICIFNCVYAQSEYANEWIDFNNTYHKFPIAEEGLYRIDYDILQFNIPQLNVNELQLFTAGQQVPIYISDSIDFNEGDFIEFHANKLDGSFDTQLFDEPEEQLHDYFSLFSDTAYYYLTTSSNAPHLRIEDVASNLLNPPPAKDYYMHRVNYFPHFNFFQGFGVSVSGVNIKGPNFSEGEGFYGDIFAVGVPNISNTIDIEMATPNIYWQGEAAKIETKIIGMSDDFFTSPDHTFQAKLNDNEFVYDTFEGYTIRKYNVDDFDVYGLTEPNSIFQYNALNFLSAADRNGLVYITLDYPHTFNFDDIESCLRFTIDADTNATDYIEISNFGYTNELPILYDLSNHLRLTATAINGNIAFHLPTSATPERDLFLSVNESSKIENINQFELVNFIDYSNLATQGNYIIITNQYLQAGNNPIADYADYRESFSGGSYDVSTIDIDQITNQFAFGIKKHPQGIKNFIDFAIDNWNAAPTHAFLIGKSVTYKLSRFDSLLYNQNTVPSYGDYPSDNIYTNDTTYFNQRLAIGRLSVNEREEVEAYLAKIIAHENPNTYNCTDTISELWKKNVLQINTFDTNNYNFVNDDLLTNETLLNLSPLNAITNFNVTNTGGNYNCNGTSAYDCIEDNLNSGVGIISYVDPNSIITQMPFNDGITVHPQADKYPLFIGAAYGISDLHQPISEESYAEELVKYTDYGFVGSIGISNYILNPQRVLYTVFESINSSLVNATIGEQVNLTIENLLNLNLPDSFLDVGALNLNCDPALRLYGVSLINLLFTEEEPIISLSNINNVPTVNITANFINEGLYMLNGVYVIFNFYDSNQNLVQSNFENINLISNTNMLNFSFESMLSQDETYTLEIIIDEGNAIAETCENDNTATFDFTSNIVGITEQNLSNFKITNQPNPFYEYTQFNFTPLNKNSFIEIIDINGKQICQLAINANSNNIIWNGTNQHGKSIADGTYFYRMIDENNNVLISNKKITHFK